MFVRSWGDIIKTEVIFECPRGCSKTKVQGIFNKMPLNQAHDILASLNPWAKYNNKCWNCKTVIDSANCRRDVIPALGFICNYCGLSLRQLFMRDEIITNRQVFIPAQPVEVIIQVPIYVSF
jgi:hypothetical protein